MDKALILKVTQIYVQGIAEMIVVSPDGTRYAVGLHRRIDIYSIENAGVEYTIDLKVRFEF